MSRSARFKTTTRRWVMFMHALNLCNFTIFFAVSIFHSFRDSNFFWTKHIFYSVMCGLKFAFLLRFMLLVIVPFNWAFRCSTSRISLHFLHSLHFQRPRIYWIIRLCRWICKPEPIAVELLCRVSGYEFKHISHPVDCSLSVVGTSKLGSQESMSGLVWYSTRARANAEQKGCC